MKKHKHVIIRAQVADPITDCFSADCLMHDIIAGIDMEILIAPQSAYCADPGNEGVTSFAVITTSHIAMHIWHLDKIVQLDVYSCKDFCPQVIFSLLHNYMTVEQASSAVVFRDDEIITEKLDFQT